jgi:hypothetical protein
MSAIATQRYSIVGRKSADMYRPPVRHVSATFMNTAPISILSSWSIKMVPLLYYSPNDNLLNLAKVFLELVQLNQDLQIAMSRTISTTRNFVPQRFGQKQTYDLSPFSVITNTGHILPSSGLHLCDKSLRREEEPMNLPSSLPVPSCATSAKFHFSNPTTH